MGLWYCRGWVCDLIPINAGLSFNTCQSSIPSFAFNLEGHGRILILMSGDLIVIEGTTILLVAQTRKVISASQAVTN